MNRLKIAQFIEMKILKYTNIMHLISLNSNAYNSCNYFSKSWECMILWESIQSLDPLAKIEPFHCTLKPTPPPPQFACFLDLSKVYGFKPCIFVHPNFLKYKKTHFLLLHTKKYICLIFPFQNVFACCTFIFLALVRRKR